MYGLGILSNEQLMEVYNQAIEIKLDQDFIDILAVELKKRGIEVLPILDKVAHSFSGFSYQFQG
jgi:hypothetical protein